MVSDAIMLTGQGNEKFGTVFEEESSFRTRGARPERIRYDIVGAIAFDGLTVYGKYYPRANSYLPGLSYWTIGIGFGFL